MIQEVVGRTFDVVPTFFSRRSSMDQHFLYLLEQRGREGQLPLVSLEVDLRLHIALAEASRIGRILKNGTNLLHHMCNQIHVV